MAAISAETEAILDRLKAEGQLTRNSGTNSIRSVNIQLDKFDKVFSTISANISKQTIMMRQMSNIQEEALEAAQRKSDFDEINKDAKSKGESTSVDAESKKNAETNEKISKGILGFLGNMSGLAKVGGAAAGTFILGNILRGYINEKFDGAFDRGLTQIGSAFGLGPDGTFNFEDLRTKFDGIATNMESVAASLSSLNTKFESLLLKMDEIMTKIDEFSLTWDKILSWGTNLFRGLTLLGIGMSAWKAMEYRRLRLSALDDTYEKQQRQRNRFAEQRNGLLRRTVNRMRAGFGLGPLGEPPIDPDGPRRPAPYQDRILRQQRIGTPRFAPAPAAPNATRPSGQPYQDQILRQQRTGGLPRSTPTVTSGSTNRTFSAAEVRQDAARNLKGYSLANNGNSLRGPDGRMVSGQAALDALERTLDAKYSRIFRRLAQFVRITGWGALLVMMFEVAMILADENMSDDDKKRALARIFLVGATAAAFAAAGAAIGSIVPGWGTLIGGLVGGIGGFFAADYVMDSIIEALWSGGNPEQARIREMERASDQVEMNFRGSELGGRAREMAAAEARAMAGHSRPIDSGGNPYDSMPADVQRILAGSQRNYFTAGDGTFYGTVPGSGENLRMSQIAPNAAFLQSQLNIAAAGASSGMNPVVVNNIAGDTYVTNQSTRMGDQNVANVQNISGTGDANPMSLPK